MPCVFFCRHLPIYVCVCIRVCVWSVVSCQVALISRLHSRTSDQSRGNWRIEQKYEGEKKREVNLKKEGMCRCFQMSMCEATSSSVALGSQCETSGVIA